MELWKANSWDENDVRDDHEFWKAEQEIYLEMFPQSAKLFKEEVKEEEEQEEQEEEEEEEMGGLGHQHCQKPNL